MELYATRPVERVRAWIFTLKMDTVAHQVDEGILHVQCMNQIFSQTIYASHVSRIQCISHIIFAYIT